MVTTDNTSMEDHVQDYVNGFFEQGSITIVVHGMETITSAIAQGSRFFTSVYRDGLQLYSANGLRLNVEYLNLNPATTFSKAQKHFYHRFGMASGFMRTAISCYDNGFINNSLFLLHQCVEQACIAVIRVYMAYRSDIHNLARLINLCRCFTDEPFALFPRKTADDQRLFQILLRSYSEARYNDDFNVDNFDAEILLDQVDGFLTLIRILCNNRLTHYRQEAETAGEIIEEYIPNLPIYLYECLDGDFE
jgi:HEPN domain-containing protein